MSKHFVTCTRCGCAVGAKKTEAGACVDRTKCIRQRGIRAKERERDSVARESMDYDVPRRGGGRR